MEWDTRFVESFYHNLFCEFVKRNSEYEKWVTFNADDINGVYYGRRQAMTYLDIMKQQGYIENYHFPSYNAFSVTFTDLGLAEVAKI